MGRICAVLAVAAMLQTLLSATQATRGLQKARVSKDPSSEDAEPVWISRMFSRELGENSSDSQRLCFESHKDLSREIRGSIRQGPALSEGFSGADLSTFPYAKQGYCESLKTSLTLEPEDCELPGFDPMELLEQIRGHRLVFWGDSIMRQFFSYVSLRLKSHEVRGRDTAGHSGELPLPDPKVCRELNSHEIRNSSLGLEIDPRCFDLPAADLEHDNCLRYLDGEAAVCYMRAERKIIDARNVVYWKALKETDIVLMNMGLHHNTRGGIRKQLRAFTRSLHYYSSNFRKLPLMIWRETSAQHFKGGEAGSYPVDESIKQKLKHVNEATFRCSSYPYEEMVGANFRNQLLIEPGFTDDNIRLIMPILRIWNVTAMASDLHPRTLARGKIEEDSNDATADCTHFCPTFGGMYEIWSTLLQNFLGAAQPLQDTLRPKILRDNTPHTHIPTAGEVLVS